MNKKHSDLIAIANPKLAEKLDRAQSARDKAKSNTSPQGSSKGDGDRQTSARLASFNQEIWQAVFFLNLIRGALAVIFIGIGIAVVADPDWQLSKRLTDTNLFLVGVSLVFISSLVFGYLIKYREIEFNLLVGIQFSIDALLATLLTYSAGSIESNFALLYLLVAAMGSVVLPRKTALGLASGIIILMFTEHFYSILGGDHTIRPNYPALARYGFLLLFTSVLISYMADKIRAAELNGFVPGNQSIEEFLVAEEIKALKAALQQTNGNKTEAAKILGMTFRSFRYKLTKYDIT